MEKTLYKNKAKAQEEVYNMLAGQNGHPLHASQIGDKICLSASQVNEIVLELRSMGFMICGDDAYDGYYFGTLDQVKKTIETIKSRIGMEQLVVKLWDRKVKSETKQTEQPGKAEEELPGQERMEI